MPQFEIVNAERFPTSLTGFVAADNGDYGLQFNETISFLYGVESNVIGLFLSEYTTRRHTPLIEMCVTEGEDYGIVFAGIITFGAHKDRSKIGTTHLEAVCRDLKLPLLRLALPSEIPLPVDFNDTKYRNAWIDNNPLDAMFSQQMRVKQDGTVATLELAEE
ncbi:hypothetical protein KC992_01250 [Candidatus Saccharibacteria bacterium]|nr:hypothetical protein [Candidatus Saccharibacteria bacterium]MCA9328855.1 hypothetical protein [Candidatus Saccharibacteria bacterium]